MSKLRKRSPRRAKTSPQVAAEPQSESRASTLHRNIRRARRKLRRLLVTSARLKARLQTQFRATRTALEAVSAHIPASVRLRAAYGHQFIAAILERASLEARSVSERARVSTAFVVAIGIAYMPASTSDLMPPTHGVDSRWTAALPSPLEQPTGTVDKRQFESPFLYTLGSDQAASSFVPLDPSATLGLVRRTGGRLVVPRGRQFAVIHESLLDGDVDAALSLVLRPGAEAAIVLKTDDGRQITAVFQAAGGDRPGVRLERRGADTALAESRIEIAPNKPHIVKLRRLTHETRVLLDDREVLRADITMSGAFRVGFAAPHGGAELRHLRFRAQRVYGDRREL